MSLRLDVRMAPKYLSGDDRNALATELGKARAMANILAAQSPDMRAKAACVRDGWQEGFPCARPPPSHLPCGHIAGGVRHP
jgi:hypothetical protein